MTKAHTWVKVKQNILSYFSLSGLFYIIDKIKNKLIKLHYTYKHINTAW